MNCRFQFFIVCFFLAAGSLCAGGRAQAAASESAAPAARESREAVPTPHESPPQPQNSRAEQVMKALAAAYPDRIAQAEQRNGDWAVLLRETQAERAASPREAALDVPPQGEWYYYAGGRLLPESLTDKAADYDPQPFYNYPAELPPWKEPSPEEAARYRDMAANRNRRPSKRSQQFFDSLWRAHPRDESYERVKSIRFLGRTVMVHYSILEELSLVEEQILAAAKTDPEVRAWIDGISTLDGWNWRGIADTQSRSFHAYGTAVDILPKSLGGKETYWLWAARKKNEWWNVAYNARFHPPGAVIKAFEANGFIWGGKWLFYDTMHFEYRPEILRLNEKP
jgi:hypothetical protein